MGNRYCRLFTQDSEWCRRKTFSRKWCGILCQTSDCRLRKALASKEAESQFQKIAGLTLSSVSSAWRSYWETCPDTRHGVIVSFRLLALCHDFIQQIFGESNHTGQFERVAHWQCVLAKKCSEELFDTLEDYSSHLIKASWDALSSRLMLLG